jgi:hypothetical protein
MIAMSLSSILRLLGLDTRDTRRPAARRKSHLDVETLEKRDLLAAAVISGYVYDDANQNGVRDAGERPIAGTSLTLLNAGRVAINSAVTDASGYYQFTRDATVDTSPRQVSQTMTFANGRTTWSQTASVNKFDSRLGTLTGVEIINSGSFRSWVRVESTDNAAQTISAKVNGTLRLTGPGLSGLDATGSATQTFSAARFDGFVDFAGGSGEDLGWRTVAVSRATMLTSQSALNQFIGSGTVSFTELANGGSICTSSSGGNLESQIASEAEAEVMVIYHYIPTDALQPGTYVIVEQQPPGYADGMETQGNRAPLPNTVGTDEIVVNLNQSNSSNNNFGEVVGAAVGGRVYHDANNNGVFEDNEAPIAGVTLTLTGTNRLGQLITRTTTTGADGSYLFDGLWAGLYTISESQPSNYADGQDTPGSLGGSSPANDQLTVNLPAGARGANYNFGELKQVKVTNPATARRRQQFSKSHLLRTSVSRRRVVRRNNPPAIRRVARFR